MVGYITVSQWSPSSVIAVIKIQIALFLWIEMISLSWNMKLNS